MLYTFPMSFFCIFMHFFQWTSHGRLNRFKDVVADCRTALEIDPVHMKGHFFLGQALCELDSMDEGIKHLQRALDISREQRLVYMDLELRELRYTYKPINCLVLQCIIIWYFSTRLNYGDELTQVRRVWRKLRFSVLEEKRLLQELELQTYLTNLIAQDRIKQVQPNPSDLTSKEQGELNIGKTAIRMTFCTVVPFEVKSDPWNFEVNRMTRLTSRRGQGQRSNKKYNIVIVYGINRKLKKLGNLLNICSFWPWGRVKVRNTGTGTYKTVQNTFKMQLKRKTNSKKISYVYKLSINTIHDN